MAIPSRPERRAERIPGSGDELPCSFRIIYWVLTVGILVAGGVMGEGIRQGVVKWAETSGAEGVAHMFRNAYLVMPVVGASVGLAVSEGIKKWTFHK